MKELYRVMVNDPKDVGWEDDSFASGWTAINVDSARDGDIITVTVQVGQTEGYIEKSGLDIDASTYPCMVVCLKGDGDFRLDVYDGEWKTVQATAGSPPDYDVKIYDLAGVTNGTITAVRLYVGSVAGRKAYYDFVTFTKKSPRFLEDVMEIRVNQRESDLDEFELLFAG